MTRFYPVLLKPLLVISTLLCGRTSLQTWSYIARQGADNGGRSCACVVSSMITLSISFKGSGRISLRLLHKDDKWPWLKDDIMHLQARSGMLLMCTGCSDPWAFVLAAARERLCIQSQKSNVSHRWIPSASLSSLIEKSEKAWHLGDDTKWQPGEEKAGRKQTSYLIPEAVLRGTKSFGSRLPSPQ